MAKFPSIAQIKFNGGRGALLCNRCSVIIREDFDPRTIEDRLYYCGGDRCKREEKDDGQTRP